VATIVVIDNEREETLHLCGLLKDAFPSSDILPDKAKREQGPFRDWEAIVSFLLGISDPEVVLCLDLSLSKRWDFEDVARGVRRANDFHASRPEWTMVAFTKNSNYAEGLAEFSSTFDGLLDKSQLARKKDHKSAVALVHSVIEEAKQHRQRPGTSPIPPNLHIVDSLGMRLFRAAFSDQILGDIVREEASNWGTLTVRSLTSGYSGAFMLNLSSDTGESLVLKVVKSEEVIANELRAQSDHLPKLAPFGVRFCPIEVEVHRLRSGSGVYYRQMPVRGNSLLEYCQLNPSSDGPALKQVILMCTRVLNEVPVNRRPVMKASERFSLTPVDVGRIETSSSFLAQIGEALRKADLWPSTLPPAQDIAAEIASLGRNWSEDDLTQANLHEAVQHGDMNPGNVMIDEDGVPVLIDFQRLGWWPLGYDLARLAGLLRIRLTDVSDQTDWLPLLFPRWCEESMDSATKLIRPASICPESNLCEEGFLAYTRELSPGERAEVEYGYYLGSLWDLLKIMSYQDISVFKREWAFVLAWRLIERLRRDRAMIRE
jgi:hypothetical protein